MPLICVFTHSLIKRVPNSHCAPFLGSVVGQHSYLTFRGGGEHKTKTPEIQKVINSEARTKRGLCNGE